MYLHAGTQAALWAIALHAAAILPFVYGFNAQLRLNDWRREAMVLAALPPGWFLGSALSALSWPRQIGGG
jgi:hypothetical protein